MVFSSRFRENEIISSQGQEAFQLEDNANTRAKSCLLAVNMVRLVLGNGFFLTKRGRLPAEAGWRPHDGMAKWVWIPKYFNHRCAILLIAWLPQPVGETRQPGGRSGPSVHWCQCCSAQPSALGSPVLLCGFWRLKTWCWILGRVMGFLTKVFFILWLPPLILSALSYRFGYRITNWGLVFSNCTVVSWFAVAIVTAPNLPVQVTFGHACTSWWPTDCVVWLYISLSTAKHSRKWVEFIGLCQQLC